MEQSRMKPTRVAPARIASAPTTPARMMPAWMVPAWMVPAWMARRSRLAPMRRRKIALATPRARPMPPSMARARLALMLVSQTAFGLASGQLAPLTQPSPSTRLSTER
jgi:hypothetical protein